MPARSDLEPIDEEDVVAESVLGVVQPCALEQLRAAVLELPVDAVMLSHVPHRLAVEGVRIIAAQQRRRIGSSERAKAVQRQQEGVQRRRGRGRLQQRVDGLLQPLVREAVAQPDDALAAVAHPTEPPQLAVVHRRQLPRGREHAQRQAVLHPQPSAVVQRGHGLCSSHDAGHDGGGRRLPCGPGCARLPWLAACVDAELVVLAESNEGAERCVHEDGALPVDVA